MKANNKNLALAAVAAVALLLPGRARAQYSATGPDGITASPKLRAALDARASGGGNPDSAGKSASYSAVGTDGIAASPKLRQQKESARVETGVAATSAPAGFAPGDGIAASPKLRSMMIWRQAPLTGPSVTSR
jgi:hypothetical protein